MKFVSTDGAPAAIGPYSQAVVAGGWCYCSGQIPLDPESGALVGHNTTEQTRQVLKNLRAVLAAAGAGPEAVVRCTVYLADMNDFAEMNGVYGEFFGEHRPARAAIEAARLPRDVFVEIDAVAFVGD